MRTVERILEWLFPSLREWRIEAEMEEGGEDAVSERDSRWMEERNRRLRGPRGLA